LFDFLAKENNFILWRANAIMQHPNEKIMRKLIAFAVKNSGGRSGRTSCFIVKGNKIVGKAISTVGLEGDPTAHGEINAISKYCKSKKSPYLRGCWIYSTQIPCPMCASAVAWAEAKGVVYGWDGRFTWGKLSVHPKEIFKNAKNKITLFGPFLEEECLKIKGYKRKSN